MLGLVAWYLTLSSTQPTARMYAHDLQTELLDTVALRLQTHVAAAQRLNGIQVANWRSNIYRRDDTPVVMSQLLDTIIVYKDLVTTQTFTTQQGGLNGFYARRKPLVGGVLGDDGVEYVKWEMDRSSSTLTESVVDPTNGTQLAVLSQQVGYNATGEKWVTQVGQNPTESSPAVWSRAYTWRGTLWITLSQAIFDSNLTYQGVACTDLDLAFISRVLSASLSTLRPRLGDSASLYALERESMTIIGTSNLSQYERLLAPSADRPFTLSELGALDPRVKLLASQIGTAQLAFPFTLRLGDVYAHLTEVPSTSATLNWTLLLLFPSSTVHDPLSAATSRSIGTVLVVVIVGISSSILVSLAISKVLRGITNDMQLLAQFQFRQVIASRDTLRGGTSWITEVWMIQNAFLRATKMFGEADAASTSLFGGIGGSATCDTINASIIVAGELDGA
ncbi:hypothetical protein BCR44DRAFT_55152 [Catenaria anguillulae PL171]|uniref:Transmembrane protein n=1 Tax=Catenaria anguillulae PL171 TaxID=765915 RepID=A0A1Y2H8C7_9FUNG|nr:hypothetical protein BCR44DRAFT_55152 [Catenaria anguillulae PL171]